MNTKAICINFRVNCHAYKLFTAAVLHFVEVAIS